ncbi:MAG: hypothetical protein PF517_12475 [Salinivirgaceae bacterium]|jgi:hypothetical protein|nr:hypothetical protein [Salinivirgaceae bacterium]
MIKRSNFSYLLAFLIVVFIAINSCQSNKGKSKVEAKVEAKVESEALYENFIEVDNVGVNYKIPSPMEMFIFLEKADANFLMSKLHKVERSENYPSRKFQALNFGIYAADLAYCSVFGDFQQALNYFNTAKNLAASLGLHEGYGESMASRINGNLNNIDSLMEISADSYHLANQFLEDQGQGDILGLILVGGWIEGIYLAIESIDGLDMENPIIERIADQQVLLENLLNYLNLNENSNNISEVISELGQIQEVFDELYFNDENTLITKKQFVDISNEIKLLRNTYIN